MKQLLGILFFFLFLHASGQTITFSKRIDIDTLADTGFAVIEIDSGYLVFAAGDLSDNANNIGAHLIFTDFHGNVQRIKSYGALGHHFFTGYGKSLHLINDGYIACGTIQDTSFANGYIARFDKNGDTVWLHEYDTLNIYAFFNCVVLSDKSTLAIGTTDRLGNNTDYVLLKVDSNLNVLWYKKYGGIYRDAGIDIDTTMDGGFF